MADWDPVRKAEYERSLARRHPGRYTGKLFMVESQSAGDMGRPPGDWHMCGEADTLEEAMEISERELAKGWCSTRIKANATKAEELRQAVEQKSPKRRSPPCANGCAVCHNPQHRRAS